MAWYTLRKRNEPLDQLLNEVIGQMLLGFIMARDLLEYFGFPTPVFQHLGGSLNKIVRNTVFEPRTISAMKQTEQSVD